MQVKNVLEEATKELAEESQEKIKEIVKASLKNVNSCKKTLRAAEKAHEELLNSDIDDIELDDYVYRTKK